MPEKLISVLLAVMLINFSYLPCQAQTQEQKPDRTVEKIRAKVAKLGTGEQAKVRVTLKGDSKEVKGYIAQAGPDSFVLKDSKTQSERILGYGEISTIERVKSHHGQNAIVFAALGGGIVAILLIIARLNGK